MAFWTTGLLVGSLVHIALSSGLVGPYYANIEEVGKCDADQYDAGDDVLVEGSFRHFRGVPYPVYSANVTVKNNWGTKGNTELTSFIDRWDRVSGWRKNYLVLRHGEICRAMQFLEAGMRPILERYYPGFRARCPIPNKTYTIYNVTSHIEPFPNYPIMFYGRYRSMNVFRSAKNASARLLACITFVVDVVEKVTNHQ